MIVIDPWQRCESREALTWFPVKDHVNGSPLDSAWNASSNRPEANTVGWPRSPGGGEKTFSAEGGSTVALFGFS